MPRSPKILLAYDGSDTADAALEGLASAGFPDAAQALVLTLADLRLPASGFLPGEAEAWYAESLALMEREARDARKEALALSRKAAARLQKLFPGWKITARAAQGEPAEEIVEAAARWKASLIVVGSHGRTALKRLLLGSVSHRVLAHAPCSVRVARPAAGGRSRRAARVLVAVDGSRHAAAAVTAASGRAWKRGTVFRVVVVGDYGATIGLDLTGSLPFRKEWKARMQRIAEQAVVALAKSGHRADAVVREGDPRLEIAAEAKRFKANDLFVGSHGHGALRRFLLGSTSMNVAEHAPCTVEVIR